MVKHRVAQWGYVRRKGSFVEPYFSRNGFLTRVKNSVGFVTRREEFDRFLTAAERIPHLSVTNSFGISFIYTTQTYLSPFKKKPQKSAFFFMHGFLTNVFVTAYDIKHTINHLIQFRGNTFFLSCISFNRVIDLLFIVLLFLTSNIIGYHKMK